ncbi:MAG: hypothetical protein QOH65_752 [Methylobacteriaceae bacterium]|jgi:hypothetical protein|nr:hypothetical protein [Methylobacteriaceae bacterium]
MHVDAASLANVTPAETARASPRYSAPQPPSAPWSEAQRRTDDTKRFYEAHFSLKACREALSSRVLPLLADHEKT